MKPFCNIKPELGGVNLQHGQLLLLDCVSKSLFRKSIIFIIQHHRRCPCAPSQSIAPCKSKFYPDLSHHRFVLPVLVLHINGIKQHVLFCMWLSFALHYVCEIHPFCSWQWLVLFCCYMIFCYILQPELFPSWCCAE